MENILAADIVLFAPSQRGRRVLVIRRGYEPYAGCWALPGGHVDPGETFAEAGRRELREETGLDVADLIRLNVYDTPDRDPRGRVVTVAHLAVLPGVQVPTAGDDARAARWSLVADLLADPTALAFDHHRILTDAVNALDPPTSTRATGATRGRCGMGTPPRRSTSGCAGSPSGSPRTPTRTPRQREQETNRVPDLPPPPPDVVPTHDDLVHLATVETRGFLDAASTVYNDLHYNPATWPSLAANYQRLAAEADRIGRTLADAIHAHSTANPEIEPPGNPPVMLLGPNTHRDLWAAAADLTTADEPDPADYAQATLAEYGRPGLDACGVDIDGIDGAVLVILHLQGAREKVVQCYAAGLEDEEEHNARLAAALARQRITPGQPRFYPPHLADRKFLSFDDGTLFDGYGRPVDQMQDHLGGTQPWPLAP